MSVRISAAVWQLSRLGGSELLLLLALADFADDRGLAYPSVRTLAGKMRMSVRNTRYLIAKVERTGEMAVHKGKGPKGCNVFRVQLSPDAILAGVQSLQAATDSREGVQPVAVGAAIAIAPEPSGTIREPSCRERSSSVRVPAARKVKNAGNDSRSRGSRLDPELQLPEEWRTFCAAERPDLEPARAFSQFRDYWVAQPGSKARKADWSATWRNWVRNERRSPGSSTADPLAGVRYDS